MLFIYIYIYIYSYMNNFLSDSLPILLFLSPFISIAFISYSFLLEYFFFPLLFI